MEYKQNSTTESCHLWLSDTLNFKALTYLIPYQFYGVESYDSSFTDEDTEAQKV
jgi:hypothetical protein